MTQQCQAWSCSLVHENCNLFPYRYIQPLSYSAAVTTTAAERFGERLREWRHHRHMSQEVLGQKVGADGPRIHRLEKGSENPTLDTLDRLAEALDIDVGQLLMPHPEREPGRVEQETSPSIGSLKESMRSALRDVLLEMLSAIGHGDEIARRQVAAPGADISGGDDRSGGAGGQVA